MKRRLRLIGASDSRGQSLIEIALVLPLVVAMVLGIVEISYALLDEHIVTKLTREGSNMISRDTSLLDARTAMVNMSSGAVNFNNGNSTVIFSVVKLGATTGTANFGQVFMYAHHQYGSFPATSVLSTAGAPSFGGPPDYVASNPDGNSSLRVTNLPANLLVVPGAMIYLTEIYSRHTLITPLTGLGINVPTTLRSIAYF
jgi:TadE-like protein